MLGHVAKRRTQQQRVTSSDVAAHDARNVLDHRDRPQRELVRWALGLRSPTERVVDCGLDKPIESWWKL